MIASYRESIGGEVPFVEHISPTSGTREDMYESSLQPSPGVKCCRGSREHGVAIVGGGIGGLTLALCLHEHGIQCRVFEAAPELKPLGAGISLLPHGTRELSRLGLLPALEHRAVRFRESCFFTGFGQLIYRDPALPGLPQFLIHRGDLHDVLLNAVRERLGAECLLLGHKCVGTQQDADRALAHFEDTRTGDSLESVSAEAVVACDGIHSAIRKQFYPDEGDMVFSGINMWRGLSKHAPFLSGGSHTRIGSLSTGKLVVYPVRDNVDNEGRQLVNWLAEVRQDTREPADWSKPGRLQDFLPYYEDWHFDWLDVPELLRSADTILEYPMVDRDPLPRWSFGRVTLLGDAAHPMVPRGSNGAMQAILDARTLAKMLASQPDAALALRAYEDARLEVVNSIGLTNRSTPTDFLIETVHQRSGCSPFGQL